MPRFGLFFFGADSGDAPKPGKYDLLFECARLADEGALEALWVPERHFQRFGGLYGSPTVAASALAVLTKRVRIRAGSVVLPLHDPLRVAEEWAMIDNISGGRVDLAFASGWHANDYALSPGRFPERFRDLAIKLAVVQRLWRGESVRLPNGLGDEVEIFTLPRPLQPELAAWLTAHTDEGFDSAVELGLNVLTANFRQGHDAEATKQRIARYQAAMLARHGRRGVVTLMTHTFVGGRQVIDEIVEPSMIDYQLQMRRMYVSLPQNQALTERMNHVIDRDERSRLRDATVGARRILGGELSFIGTPDELAERARCFDELGIDEVACLVDFGVPPAEAVESVRELCRLAERFR